MLPNHSVLCPSRKRETGKRDKKHCGYNRDFYEKHLASRLIPPDSILYPFFSYPGVNHLLRSIRLTQLLVHATRQTASLAAQSDAIP
jgi:hypothetical protein